MVNVFFGFLSLGMVSYSGVKKDLVFITEINPIAREMEPERYISVFTFKEVSEVKLTTTGIIRFYQIFMSTQDVPCCNFTLTCSRFMSEAIRKYGAFYGLLMAGDRLHRCIGAARKYYPRDPRTGLAIDYPVERYYLGKPGEKSSEIDSCCYQTGSCNLKKGCE